MEGSETQNEIYKKKKGWKAGGRWERAKTRLYFFSWLLGICLHRDRQEAGKRDSAYGLVSSDGSSLVS